jgi:hypothetical protein
MVSIKGYKYTTENQAIEAKLHCNEYYGIPNNVNDVTKNWVDYQFAELNDPQFYYIVYDDTLVPVLGEPINFEVIMPELNLIP